jgi:hypothetical protein
MVFVVKEKVVVVQLVETRLGISLLGKDSFSILETMELFDSNMEPKTWDNDALVGEMAMGLRDIGFAGGI